MKSPKFKVGDHVVYKDGSTPFIVSYYKLNYRGSTRYWGDRTDHQKGLAIGGYESDLVLVKDKK